MFTQEQKIFIVESYFRTGHLEDGEWIYELDQCFEDFRAKFPDVAVTRREFCRSTTRFIDSFRSTGSVNRKEGGRARTVRTPENIDNISQRLEQDPMKSLRRLSQEVGVSYGSCQRIVKVDLGLYPYKVQVYQELLPPDYARRVAYCQWFTEHLGNNNDLLDLTFFTDEAWFHLSGYVNNQNMRMWSAENPHFFRESSMHPVKIGVWVAMSRRRLIGPIFFEETVTAERYRRLMFDVFVEQLHDDELRDGYFQQDGATAHTARDTLNHIREFYDERIISKDLWPARSPDLTPLDYFLFPHLKNNIFKEPVHTLEDLKERIRQECANVTPEILRNVFENMKRRVALCTEMNGYHFQQFL